MMSDGPDPMVGSLQDSSTPLADYEDEEDKPDQCRELHRNRHRDGTGTTGNLASPDMMDLEVGTSPQFTDSAFSLDGNKERLDKTAESLSTKARQFITKNRAMEQTNVGSGCKTTTVTHTAEDPPPSPAPTSFSSQSREKICDEMIDFPPQFFTIRAARLRAANTAALGDSFGIRRGVAGVARPDAEFRVEGDVRCFPATNFHRTDVNRNVSASVTVGLLCLACDSGHSYRESIGEGIPIVMVLSDQAFPAILPATDNKCVIVIRVEDGLLSEIDNAFRDLLLNF